MPENPYGLTDSEMQQISLMSASAEQVNPNFIAGMLSGDPQAANVGSQLQAQQTRGRQQRLRGLEGALQSRAQGRATTARGQGLLASKVKARQSAAALARTQSQEDYERDRADEVADLEFKREQAMDLAGLRNQRLVSQTDKEKARLNRQERRFRMAHHKTQQAKDLGPTISKSLHDQSKTIEFLSDSLENFDDDYVTSIGVVGRAQNIIASEVGFLSTESMDKRAAWWRQYKRFIELVERHEFFGATLTKGENLSWKQAEINTGMKPAEVRKNLEKRLGMMKNMFSDYAKGISKTKKNPGAVSTIIGGLVSEEDLPTGYEEFPEHILQDSISSGVERALEDMSEDELQEALEELGG